MFSWKQLQGGSGFQPKLSVVAGGWRANNGVFILLAQHAISCYVSVVILIQKRGAVLRVADPETAPPTSCPTVPTDGEVTFCEHASRHGPWLCQQEEVMQEK